MCVGVLLGPSCCSWFTGRTLGLAQPPVAEAASAARQCTLHVGLAGTELHGWELSPEAWPCSLCPCAAPSRTAGQRGWSQSRSSLLQADVVPEHRRPMPVLFVLQELCLIRFHPATEEEEVAYISLYSYFSSRGRFGVVANNSRHIKDLYLIPLSAEDPVPSKLLPFEGPGEHRLSGWWSGTSAHTCPLPPHQVLLSCPRWSCCLPARSV